MERRNHVRLDTNTYASLHYPPLGLLQVKIANFSKTGIYILLNNIRLNTYSEAEFIECINNILLPTRTQIVRVSAEGAGLKFLETEPLILKRLLTNIHQPSLIDDNLQKSRAHN